MDPTGRTPAKPLVRKLAGRPPIPAPDLEALDSESGEPIERQVYQSLRRSMMSGAILPGAKVSSRSIASSLGVSSMPVREALKRLESDGAVSSSIKSAFTINYPTVDEFREILKIRLQLEVMLAREATPLITTAIVDRIAWLQERMAQSRNYQQILNYNYKMHFLLYRSAGMPYAVSLVENVWVRIGPMLHAIHSDKVVSATLFDHHNTIVEGLRERNLDRVGAAVRADLEDGATVIERMLAHRIETNGAGLNGLGSRSGRDI